MKNTVTKMKHTMVNKDYFTQKDRPTILFNLYVNDTV